jgi:hypothetical protein
MLRVRLSLIERHRHRADTGLGCRVALGSAIPDQPDALSGGLDVSHRPAGVHQALEDKFPPQTSRLSR